jgi:hypothetical protein
MRKSHLRLSLPASLPREFMRILAGAASVRVGRLKLAIGIVCSLAGCNLWTERKLREDGPTPFTRCAAAAAPRARTGTIAGVSIDLKDRWLQLSKSAPALRLSVFGAAGLGEPPAASDLAKLRATTPDVLLLLGGLGESAAVANATVKALAGLGRLVLVIAGGRDAYRVVHEALAAAGEDAWVVDATALRSISIGKDVLIPWGGSEQGRYALDETHCGFGARDVHEAAAALGPAGPEERRWLASWQALPAAGERRAIREAGELGSELVRLHELLGVRGSLGAWPAGPAPSAQPGPLTDWVVGRAWGPSDERSDGSDRASAVSVLVFDTDGPRIER